MKKEYNKPSIQDLDAAFDGVLCGSASLEEYSGMQDDENINDWL